MAENVTGRILEVDLSLGKIGESRISLKERKLYLGGKGTALSYLHREMEPESDPLGPENKIVFMNGLYLGSGAPCSGRWAAVTKSPLTGIYTSSSCGGPFGSALMSAGFEGLVVSGRAEKPVFIEITSEGVHIIDAGMLWGKGTTETQTLLSLEKGDGACVIGPAGENRVLFANIVSGKRFVGRGGMGAVMGSKNCKALLVRHGDFKVEPVLGEAFRRLKKRAVRDLNANAITAGAYRNFGTAFVVDPCNEGGAIPVHNFKDRYHKRTSEVSGASMAKRYKTKASTCSPCSILCGHKGSFQDGKRRKIPEYETVAVMGPNLGIFDTDLISGWNEICSEMGMDTISTGVTLSFVMEATEKEILDGGISFGKSEGISDLLYNIAYRRGLGDDCANGTKWLSGKYGGREYAIHIKGLEMSGYDPRGAFGQGLSYAVCNRGGCHLASYPIALEIFLGWIDPYTHKAKPEWVVFFEDLYAAINSLHACLFLSYAFIQERPVPKYVPMWALRLFITYLPRISQKLLDWSYFSKFFSTITGIRVSRGEFLKIGRRIHVLERYMNSLEGISRKDDTLPPRFLEEAETNHDVKTVVPLSGMLDRYYRLRGYSGDGVPQERKLKKLKIPVRGKSAVSA